MDVNIYKFPPMESKEAEVKFCELLNIYRNGGDLPEEVKDWMDTANVSFMTSKE